MSWSIKGEAAAEKTCDQVLLQCAKLGYGSAGKSCRVESVAAWDRAMMVKSCRGKNSQLCNNARIKGPEDKLVLDRCIGGIIMRNGSSQALKNCLINKLGICDNALDTMLKP